MFDTAPAPTIHPSTIRRVVTGAGMPDLNVVEQTSGYDYVGTDDGSVGVTWYRRNRSQGPALVFELDVDGYSVSDAADSEQMLLDLLSQAITEGPVA